MDEFVMSEIEMNSTHKNFKASKIELTSDSNISLKMDDLDSKINLM